MLLKYFKVLLLTSLFLIVSGCMYGSLFYDALFVSREVKLSIDKLPEATVNQPYQQRIEIYNAGAIIHEDQIQWEITPNNSGLNIDMFIASDQNGYGGVEIFGMPKLY